MLRSALLEALLEASPQHAVALCAALTVRGRRRDRRAHGVAAH
jgi:hypothetical protein